MLLMIDNYDSFTYNLVQYLSELGADLQVYRNDELSVAEVLSKNPSGIVLSPGPGRPEQGGIMTDMINEVNGTVPILGVCLGHQAIAQAYGGNITYAPVLMHGKTSLIKHFNAGLFKEIPNPFTATRYHSLIVERETLPDCFDITAETSDNIIMGIKHKEFPLYGLQFHPESILSVNGKDILRNFLKSLL